MNQEINLLKNYPQTKRNPIARQEVKKSTFDHNKKLAKKFEKEYFDETRDTGYGGYNYHPRFFEKVVTDIYQHYNLKEDSAILDIGCGKGFMLYDFKRLYPSLKLAGVDISKYAIENAHSEMTSHLQNANALSLPFQNNSFDLVISLNTLHNLEGDELELGFNEMMRVSKGPCYVYLDAYRNEEERKLIEQWNLTALTIKHIDQWKEYFDKIGYNGDYYWFFP
jgi:SAM-dependent methyltransferase